jgi:hypothetical protein
LVFIKAARVEFEFLNWRVRRIRDETLSVLGLRGDIDEGKDARMAFPS